MNFSPPAFSWGALRARVKGLFNLNDPQWGRGEDKPGKAPEGQNASPPPSPQPPPPSPPPGAPQGPNQGPPDLEQLWRDVSNNLGGLFGKGKGGRGSSGSPGNDFQPDMKNAGIGLGLIGILVLFIWLGTGFFVVQEGNQAVITQFGEYHSTVKAGWNYRWPYPIQRHEVVSVTQLRSVDVGEDSIVKATGLRGSAMLTEDENIVEIKFAVQYRLSNAQAYLFSSKDPTKAVVQAAKTAVREVVGKMKMDSALSEGRDQIGPRVHKLMQSILDRYEVGIEVVGINLQQGGVRPPEQVQSAFDDVLKAGQERERLKNEAQAYANSVIPGAVGTASRMKEEADAYKADIVARAQGDAQRFRSVLTEYQKAPQVTRDRMYLDAMRQIYSGVTKVLVDSKQGSSFLYLPLDKVLQSTATVATESSNTNAASGAAPTAAPTVTAVDPRSRDVGRTRERESR